MGAVVLCRINTLEPMMTRSLCMQLPRHGDSILAVGNTTR
eukprot:COSAG01_NODE_35205_length_535_cov_1.350917_1_plen_39_part_10